MSKEINGAQALAASLVEMGTSRIYGVIGTSNAAFTDTLYGYRDKIHYVSCRHEQVAASMADAEGRLTGKPGVALVHSGPGALNAMISAGNAYKDCSPMFVITGAVKRRLQGSDGMLEVDHCRLFDPLCKGTIRVRSAREVPDAVARAYRLSMSGARGPVLIEVPEDVWAEKANLDPGSLSFDVEPPPEVDRRDILEAVDMMNSAGLPLILSGGGVAYSGSSADLARLVDSLKSPVITTGNGRGTIPETHPLSLGRVGFGGGNPVADKALEKCDALLCLGSSISDMTTYEFTAPVGAKKIMVVNVSPESVAPQSPECRLVLCDVAEFIRGMLEEVGGRDGTPEKNWELELAEVKALWNGLLQASLEPGSVLPSPGRVVKALHEALPDETIVSVGAGMHLLYAMAFMPCTRPLSFLSTVNFGSMGFGMAAAMAAKMTSPGREVLSVLGDGDLMMTIQDLETVKREEIGIKVVVLNDSQYRVLNFRQRLQYEGRIIGTEHGNPDFSELAQCFGVKGLKLYDPDQTDRLVEAAVSQNGPVLLEVLIDPEDVPPMNIEANLRMSAG